MNLSVIDSLNNIVFLVQELVEELEFIREQVSSNTIDQTDQNTVSQSEMEAVQHEAFEYLVNKSN